MALTASQQAAQQKAMAARNVQNAAFMRMTYEEWGLADAQNGTTFKPGSNPLNFQVPVTELAYATKLVVRADITFNYTAAGASPTVSTNAGAPWNAIQNIEVMYGNRQILVHPYFEAQAAKHRGVERVSTNTTTGNQNTDIQTMLYKFPAISAGSNEWKFDVDVPLNRIHPQSVWGILPIFGTGTRLQINVTPCAAFTGADPLLNPISTNGTIDTFGGSITVLFKYRDFKSMYSRAGFAPNLAGVPTVQVIQPQQINPLTAGTAQFQRINNPYEFARLQILVIDGQSSGTFCSASNLQSFELDRAENNSSVLRKYDSSNGGIQNYYRDVREMLQTDLDEGYLFFDAMIQNGANPSNMGGDAYLNLSAGDGVSVPQGFPAARYGVQVGSVGSVCTPRVIVYGTIINRAGIQLSS